MATYTITNAVRNLDDSGNQQKDDYGNVSWKIFVKDSSDKIYSFFKNAKPEREFKIGDSLEGNISQEVSKAGKDYWKFIEERQGPPGGKSYGKSPEEQDAIIRQNALTNSVAYSIGFANLLMQGTPTQKKRALEVLDGKSVLKTASFFAKFSKGEVNFNDLDISDKETTSHLDNLDMSSDEELEDIPF